MIDIIEIPTANVTFSLQRDRRKCFRAIASMTDGDNQNVAEFLGLSPYILVN